MKKFSLLFRKWHRWLALIVGVQLFLWTLSGFYMSLVPIENIRSEHLVKKTNLSSLNQLGTLKSFQEILGKEDSEVLEVSLKMFLNHPVYEIRLADKASKIINARTGEIMSPISESLARDVALHSFAGKGSVRSIKLITDDVIEYRGKYPVWRVDFDNWEQTSFYVSPENGKLTARRGLLWRVYDFLWMLHIMDYSQRSNFNNWWLVLAAILALTMSATGLILLRYSFRWKKIFKK